MNRLPDETLTQTEWAHLERLTRAAEQAPPRARDTVRALGEVATWQASATDGLKRLEAELPGQVIGVPEIAGTAAQVADGLSLSLAETLL
jgi:hypothetical protein